MMKPAEWCATAGSKAVFIAHSAFHAQASNRTAWLSAQNERVKQAQLLIIIRGMHMYEKST
jgi:hypothetical protein